MAEKKPFINKEHLESKKIELPYKIIERESVIPRK